jgi:CRP/FNR family cyclic AMP-dependent transcriptional regulator
MADPRVQLLRRIPLFADCSDDELAFIATQVDEVEFVPGRVLCREGDPGGEFFVIVSGTAAVERQGQFLHRLSAGDFFGEIALLDGGPRTATVTVKEAMRCLVLGRGQFHNVIRQNATIAVAVLQTLGERLRSLLSTQPL